MFYGSSSGYLDSHYLLYPSQRDYRPCHSTEVSLLKLTKCILLDLDGGDVSVDLSIAFNTVEPKTLFLRFQSLYGISGTVVSLFQSHLTGKTETVNGHSSEPANVSFGAPQGSVLGSVLFILYSAPLPSLTETPSSPSSICRRHTAVSILYSCSDTRQSWPCRHASVTRRPGSHKTNRN